MAIDRVDEAFLLLALQPDGSFAGEVAESLDEGLAGAWLAELLVDGRLRIREGKVDKRNHSSMDDPALDWVLARISSRRRSRPPGYWVAKIGKRAAALRPGILARLARRGNVDLAGEPGSLRYPPKDTGRRASIVHELREALSGRRQDESLLALLAVLDGAGLLGHVFGRGQEQAFHNAVVGRLQRDHRLLALAAGIRRPHSWWLHMFT